MESDALARLLFEQQSPESLEQSLAHHASELDEDVIFALGRIAEEQQLIDARHTVQLANIARSIAQRLGTTKAHGLAAWFKSASALANLDYSEAIVQLETAEKLLSTTLPSSQLLGMSVNRILLLKQTGEYTSAIHNGKLALDACAEIGPTVDHHKANLHRILGQVHFFMGNYNSALEHLDSSKEKYLQLDDVANAAMLAMSRTLVLEALGEFSQIERDLKSSLETLQEISAHKEAARVRFRLGEFAYLSGQYEQALCYLEQARFVFQEQGLRTEIASIDLVRSSVLLKLSFVGEAIQLAEDAEEVLGKANLPYFKGVAARNQALGHLLLSKPKEAKRCNERAIKAFTRINAEAQILEAKLLSVRIMLQMEQGSSVQDELNDLVDPEDFKVSPLLFVRALLYRAEIFLREEIRNPDAALKLATRASEIAQAHHLVEEGIRAASFSAQACLNLGDLTGERRFHRAAVKNLGHYQNVTQTELVRLGQSRTWGETLNRSIDSAHSAVIGGMARIDELALFLAISRGFTTECQEPDVEQHNFTSPLESQLRGQLAKLRKHWHWNYEALENQRKLSDSVEGLPLDLQTVQKRLKRLERKILDYQLRLAALRVETRKPTLLEKDDGLSYAAGIHRALKHKIPKGSALLVYYQAQSYLHCLLVTRDTTRHYPRLGKYHRLEELVRKWRFLTNQFPMIGLSEDLYRLSTMLMHEFARYLISPLKSLHAGEFSQLKVSLPGRLSEIPFSALRQKDHTLIEQYEICQLTDLSITSVSRRRHTIQNPQAMLLSLQGHTDLEYLKTEIDGIMTILKDAGWTVTDSAGQISDLKAKGPKFLEASLIHVAGHGHHRTDNPLFSLVEVGEAGLTAADVCLLNLACAPHVFLHACDTGKVETFGNFAFGLSRAFLQAGASGVIANLWPVIDEIAPVFARRFYETYIDNGGNASQALAKTQRLFLGSYEPIVWANYVYRQ